MIEINLLPKEYRKTGFNLSLGKTGLYVVGAGVAAICALIVISVLQIPEINRLESDIQRAQQRAEMLRRDIALVDALTDVKAKITRRVQAVEKLDRNRTAWVRLMEELASDVPEFVWLSRFSEGEAPMPEQPADEKADSKAKKGQKDKKPAKPAEVMPTVKLVEVEGYAFTLNAIAAFMINLMRSEYFDDIELVFTNETRFDEHRAYNFVLSGEMHFLADEDARRMFAQQEQSPSGTQTSHRSLN